VLGEFGAHASRYGKDAIGLMVRRTRAELVEVETPTSSRNRTTTLAAESCIDHRSG
jgi:hypothetical protein